MFETYEDILDAACAAWNAVLDAPWRIMSVGLRDWARTGQSSYYPSCAPPAAYSGQKIGMIRLETIHRMTLSGRPTRTKSMNL